MTPQWNHLEDAQLALGTTTAAGVLAVVTVGFALRLMFIKRTRWARARAACETALFLGIAATAASIPFLSIRYAWDRDLWITLAANAALPPVALWWVRYRYGWPSRRKH
ncbi:hypothetical protein ABZ943_02870 [Streptomyces rubiginosohelvolus]|uniref:hypothetical protein n=1 Tax=Streptomyces TaxID=1883 RepID=UPI000BF23AC7|nr:hypothetical protein [Streptomyces sp. b62]